MKRMTPVFTYLVKNHQHPESINFEEAEISLFFCFLQWGWRRYNIFKNKL